MIDQVISKRYALALYHAAEAAGGELVQQIEKGLSVISEIWENSAEFRAFLEAPQIDKGEKGKILQETFREKIPIPELLFHFLLLLLKKNRIQHISGIKNQYDNLMKESENLVEVQVFTAFSLDKTLSSALKVALEKKTGKNVDLLFKFDPGLIGGIKVIIGNQIIDNSIKTELDRLKEDLLSLKV